VFAALLSGLSLAVFFVWSRERRLRSQRHRLRKTYLLGEQILGAGSAEDILSRLSEALTEILGVTRVHLYVYNRATKTLDSVTGESVATVSLSLSAPPAGPQTLSLIHI